MSKEDAIKYDAALAKSLEEEYILLLK